MKINELFTDVITEDLNYEFKAKLNNDNPLKWAKTMIAFANGNGGFIFIGVNNNREVFGLTLDEIDETKNLISTVNDRHIFPHIKYKYEMRSVDENAEKFVLCLKVLESDGIVRWREGDFNEQVFTRGDGNSLPSNPEEIISLSKRKFGVDAFVTEEKFNEKDFSEYFQLCKQYRLNQDMPSLKEMQNYEIIDADEYITTGLSMFKDEYNGDDTEIHCRLFRGLTKSDEVIDRVFLKGSISKCFIDAMNFFKRNTRHGYKKLDNGKRENTFAYPEIAFREALVNAIAHRDYSIYGTQIDIDIFDNRIEITSPGSWLLPKKYDEYDIGHIPSIRRNKIISACLDLADLMERGGTGFQTIYDSYQGFDGIQNPELKSYDGFVTIVLYDILAKHLFDLADELVLDEEQERIIDYLHNGPSKIGPLMNISKYKSKSSFFKYVLNPLLENDIVERIGNNNSPNLKYKLK